MSSEFKRFTVSCLVFQNVNKNCSRLFTRQLAVKARQCYSEGLQCAHGVPVVHGEHVVGHSSELHDDVVRVAVVDHLEQNNLELSGN